MLVCKMAKIYNIYFPQKYRYLEKLKFIFSDFGCSSCFLATYLPIYLIEIVQY